MAEDIYSYRIDILRKMLEAENGYGARLHMDSLPPITIDADALKELISYYELKSGRE